MRTLVDSTDSSRLERRTALIVAELSRYDVDVAAISESRLPGDDQE